MGQLSANEIAYLINQIFIPFLNGEYSWNALFVALSVPLSMFIAFLVMPSIGFSFNMRKISKNFTM